MDRLFRLQSAYVLQQSEAKLDIFIKKLQSGTKGEVQPESVAVKDVSVL